MNGNSSHRDLLGLFAHHKVAANLLMAIMFLAGFWALSKLNTQFFPNFALDIINVRIIWSGASAEDVESAITNPLEQELRTLDNLNKISSTSATGVSAITLEFKEGTEMGAALDSVNEMVARIRNLPSSAEDPEITRIIRYEPIARLLITGMDHVNDARQLANDIKDELLSRGIAKIDITGLPDEEISIQVPSLRLQEINLSLEELGQRIRGLSQDLPAGFVGEKEVARQLRSLDQRREVSSFNNLAVISDQQGRLLNLDDIAHIERRPLENQTLLYLKDQPAIELLLQRTETSDALVSANILSEWMDTDAKQLPAHIKLQVFDESWQYIKERIMLLVTNGLGGLVLVIGILYLFLNGRVAFWVVVGIPISFMATLAILYAFGGSINMISLFGLIMAVGIIVDDAIVVAEDAQSNYEHGMDPEKSAEAGARRMLAPVMSSSLTTVAAFLPLILVGGVIGNIMFQIPLVIICVVIASVIECFLILPAHMRMSFVQSADARYTKFREHLDRQFNRIRDHFFKPIVIKAVNNRGVTISAALGMLILSIGMVAGGRIGFTFFPSVESKIIYANVSFTAGTPPSRVFDFLQEMERALRKTEQQFGENLIEIALTRQGVSSSGGGTGQRTGDQYGSMFIELISPDQRDFRNNQFVKAWQDNIVMPPGIELFTLSQRNAGPPGQDIDIRLTGADPFVLKNGAIELMEKLKTYPGVSAIEDDLPWGQEQLVYHLTPTGHALGLTVNEVGRQLRAAFDGYLIQTFQQRQDEVEVRLMLPDEERHSLAGLNTFHIKLPNGQSESLSNVVDLTARKGFEALRHSDGKLTLSVTANVDRAVNNANNILFDLQQNYLPGLEEKFGLRYFLEGRASEQADTMTDMKRGLLFAMILIYLILAWVFASYSKPLVIMSAIPFGFIGAILGHAVMGIELTILSIFGIIGLSGIVVNDSIILINLYQFMRASGTPVADAIIESARLRLRAVLLTSLTTIAGLTPLLFETSVQAQFLIPMAVSITFGLAFSTILVLLVIPAILSVIESVVHRIKGHNIKSRFSDAH